MVEQVKALQEIMPDDFYLSIRHLSSFKNISEYEVYLKKEIEKWQKK